MAIKFYVESLEGIDEPVAKLYTKAQSGKGFYLDVDGAVASDRLDEFRTNNVELKKKLDEFKDVDPKRYLELTKIAEKAEADAKAGKKNLTADEINQMVEDRLEKRIVELRKEHETVLTQTVAQRDQLQNMLNTHILDSAVTQAIGEVGALPGAIPDLTARVRQSFVMKDGRPTHLDSAGNIVYDKSGKDPLSVAGWLQNLKTSGSAGHLFEKASGSGASSSRTGAVDMSKLSATDKIRMGLEQR